MPAVRHVLTLATLVCALSIPTLAVAQTGGPDSSGYIFGPTVYDWQDLSTNANATQLAMGDDTVVAVTLPWAFPWYGNTYGTTYIDSNGKIMFDGAAGTDWSNVCLGVTDTNPPDIAPFWDDLSPNLGGGVYAWYDAANDRAIASWEDVPHFGGSDGVSFQVHLYVNGTVEIHWEDTDFQNPSFDNGASATIGIQDEVGGTFQAGQMRGVVDQAAFQYGRNLVDPIGKQKAAVENGNFGLVLGNIFAVNVYNPAHLSPRSTKLANP